MPTQKMNVFRELYVSRLNTLTHIVEIAEQHFGDDAESILQLRLIDDMLPFATQVAYTCNQPHNFILWCENKEDYNLDPELQSISLAKGLINDTKSRLMTLALDDKKLDEPNGLDFEGGRYIEFKGVDYINEFLLPNFYFHLVTAYNIVRMKGAALGKGNYMAHLFPLVRQA